MVTNGVVKRLRAVFYGGHFDPQHRVCPQMQGRIFHMARLRTKNSMYLSPVENEPWHSRGVRKLIVDNYIVFYYPNDQTKEVIIFQVFHGGRIINELLDK